MTEIDDHLLRVLFDTAVGSMNFGSGFLDDEEVAALRQVAVILGVDPEVATPQNFKCKYRGHHEAQAGLDRQLFISFADGLWRNAYKCPDDYPLDARRFLKAPSGQREVTSLGRLQASVIYMWCPDCGRRWDAFEDTTWRG